MRYRSPIAILLLSMSTAFADSPTIYYKSPAALLAEIGEKGPNLVIDELLSTENSFAYVHVLKNIQSGKRDWLEVGRQLNETNNTGVAEVISDTISSAIINDPREVLSYSHFSANLHCGGFDIGTDDRFQTPETMDKEFLRRIQTVEAIRDKALERNKLACLQMLRKRRLAEQEAWKKLR